MGTTRNGARTFLTIVAHACKLSHLPGFRQGLNGILGVEQTSTLYGFWTPFCNYVESLIALDNWFNKRDTSGEWDAGEDTTPLG